MTFNLLDFMLIMLLLLGTVWGLFQGFGKLLIGLLSLYVGLVVSLILYQPLARFLHELLPGMSVSGTQALAFAFLMLVIVNGLSLLTRALSTPSEERKQKPKGDVQEVAERGCRRYLVGPLNQLGGLALGLVVTGVWISLVLAVAQFVIRAGVPQQGAGAARSISHQLGSSVLVPWFNQVLYLVYQSVRFWIPGDGVPAIFSQILQI